MAIFTDRFWADAFWHPTGVAAAYAYDQSTGFVKVRVEVNEVVVFDNNAGDQMRFLRGAYDPAANLRLCGHDSSDHMRIWDGATWTDQGAMFGNHSNAVSWNGTEFVFIAQESATTYRRIRIGSADVTGLPMAFASSQGFLSFVAGAATDGAQDQIEFRDPAIVYTLCGLPILIRTQANGVRCGVWNQFLPDNPTVALLADCSISQVSPSESGDPRIAFGGDGRWITAGWLIIGGNRIFITISPPWPNLIAGPGSGGGGGSGGGSGASGGSAPSGADTLRGDSGVAAARRLPQRREYPEVDHVPEDHTRRTLKLLWDKIWAFEDRFTSQEALIGTHESALAAANLAIERVRTLSESTAIAATLPTGVSGAPPSGPGPPPSLPPPVDPPPGGEPEVDDGLGAQGCNQAGPTGHVPATTELNAIAVGMIVCGTGHEFPALSLAAASQAIRDANQAELLGRVIWHLQLAGFQAGKQRNPSMAISGDKVTVLVDGFWRAYDIFTGPPFDQPLTVKCDQVFPADHVPDGGVPD